MTSPDLVCKGCGARPRGPAERFCAYCGAALPVPRSDADRRRDEREARFAALRAHPAARSADAHRPSAAPHLLGAAFGTGFLVLFVLVALAIAGGGALLGGFGGATVTGSPWGGALGLPFVVVPLAMAAFGVYAAVRSAGRAAHIASAPLECVAALVRDQRTQVSRTGEHGTSTSTFVTLEAEDGERTEYPLQGRLIGRVAVDDIGFAYVQGGALLDFRRVDV